jgi:hypothetical protein
LLLNTDLGGGRITDPNFRLRFFLIFFAGLIALASILYWRSKLLLSQEYVDFPQHAVPKKSLIKAPAASQQNGRLQKELQNENN